jgi:hypothetical protein
MSHHQMDVVMTMSKHTSMPFVVVCIILEYIGRACKGIHIKEVPVFGRHSYCKECRVIYPYLRKGIINQTDIDKPRGIITSIGQYTLGEDEYTGYKMVVGDEGISLYIEDKAVSGESWDIYVSHESRCSRRKFIGAKIYKVGWDSTYKKKYARTGAVRVITSAGTFTIYAWCEADHINYSHHLLSNMLGVTDRQSL